MKLLLASLAIAVSCGLLFAESLKPGDSAPNWTLQDLRGAEVKLASYHGKNVVVFKGSGATGSEALRGLADLDVVPLFAGGQGRATLLIDQNGIVRRIAAGELLAGADLVRFAQMWLEGHKVYMAKCSRCHGEDGDSSLCMDVKPLVGIGGRMNVKQIREAMRPADMGPDQVLIRDQYLTRGDFDAVVAYIAGL
jgi:hypothetical protein